MKTESRIPRLENSALGTQDSELARGGAMKNVLSVLPVVAVAVVGAIAEAQQATKVYQTGFLKNSKNPFLIR